MARDILVEIGLEELPARFVDDAESQLLNKTKQWLSESRIPFSSIESFSTPRRLAVLVKEAAEEQQSLEEEVKGPALKFAQDEDHNWTKAATGFTKGQGKTVDDIYTRDVKGTTYIFVKKYTAGKPTRDLLPQFSDIITSIHFPQTMRWGDRALRYARPIRWIAALFGQDIIPFELAGVQSGNCTDGHRFLGDMVTISAPSDYEQLLEDQYVIVDPARRRQMITDGLTRAETAHGFQVQEDDALLSEVSNLVEYPTVFVGSFAESYLSLPPEVLITSMKEHQRYFPVQSENGALLPKFAAVRNGDDDALETVIKGNEKVLRARLSDAQFFFEEDQKQSIDFYLDKLERIVFQEKLGTIGDKVRRVTAITQELAEKVVPDDEETAADAVRAAQICKFDLPTNMVDEFTNLQGIIGETYALNAGEKQTVARAVSEHYRPVQADGELPGTMAGAIVSVADKLDTITGCIAAGLIPSGSQDPYGLRRQATGVLKILRAYNWTISLESLLELAKRPFSDSHVELSETDKSETDAEQFFRDRITYLLKSSTIEQDVIQAVMYHHIGVIPYMVRKAKNLSCERTHPAFKPVQEALVRVINLAAKTNQTDISHSLFETDSEKALYEAYITVGKDYKHADNQHDAEKALRQLGKLSQPIHAFFEHNMVMTDDERIRNNRLALLNQIAALINHYADMSAIEWKQHF